MRNLQVDAKWPQHFSCILAFLATLTTVINWPDSRAVTTTHASTRQYIIDIMYEKSVSKKAPGLWKPEQGYSLSVLW